jgi:thiamine biosynthesis lipoprotein
MSNPLEFHTQRSRKAVSFLAIKAVVIAVAGGAVIGFFLSIQGCNVPTAPITQTRDLPFAHCTLVLYDHADKATFAACFERIETLLRKFNMYSIDSEISAVNRAAGKGAVAVSDDFREALHQGLELAKLTDGMFDPTVGPIVKLWAIGSDKAHVPRPDEIQSALRLVAWKDVVLDEQAHSVVLPRAGMTLDFGAILKGFAAVEGGRILSARGVKSAIMDIGGSVLALGSRPGGAPWRIGVQKPGASSGTILGEVQARDQVVNTSGAYEQFFRKNGHRYQHIMNPHTGYPVDNGVESVTVIANRLRNADGPALSVLALGVKAGLAFAERIGIDVIIVGSDGSIYMTPGVNQRFTLVDSTYHIVLP